MQRLEIVPEAQEQLNALLIPLPTGDDAKALGMFGVFNADSGGG
jgi:hypothetical protein